MSSITKELIEKRKELEKNLKEKAKEARIADLQEKIEQRRKELEERRKQKVGKEVIDYIKTMERGGVKIFNKQTGKISEEARPFVKAAKQMIGHKIKMKQLDETTREKMIDVDAALGKRTQDELKKLLELQKQQTIK